MIDPFEKLSLKIWGNFSFLHLPLWFLSPIHVKLPMSNLAAQIVTSTSLENLFFTYSMNFLIQILICTLQRPWFYTSGRFFQWGSPNKIMDLKNISHENPVEVKSFDGIY